MATMDNIIHKAAKKFGEHKLVEIDNLNNRLYFFFRQELMERGVPMHHAIPNKGRIYDYIVGAYYDTLHEWAEAWGRTTTDILYGCLRGGRIEYISLNALLLHLNPKWIETPRDVSPATIRQDNTARAIEYLRLAIDLLETTSPLGWSGPRGPKSYTSAYFGGY
jgi:hypothetical protein